MGSQRDRGKAFEYSCLLALYNQVQKSQQVRVESTAALEEAKKAYQSVEPFIRKGMVQQQKQPLGFYVPWSRSL